MLVNCGLAQNAAASFVRDLVWVLVVAFAHLQAQ